MSKLGPSVAVGEADFEVVGGETEFAHGVDGEGDELGIGSGGVVTEDVGIELVELAGAAFLRGFVAKALPDFEPLERFGVFALLGGGEAGERGGDFGAEGDVAVALVLEAEELRGEFAPRLFQSKVRWVRGGGSRIRRSHNGWPRGAKSRRDSCASGSRADQSRESREESGSLLPWKIKRKGAGK